MEGLHLAPGYEVLTVEASSYIHFQRPVVEGAPIIVLVGPCQRPLRAICNYRSIPGGRAFCILQSSTLSEFSIKPWQASAPGR